MQAKLTVNCRAFYLRVIPQNVAQSPEVTQARAHVLVQDPAHAAELSVGLTDQLVAVPKKP